MIEDKLTHAERLRLDCLNLSVAMTTNAATVRPTLQMYITNAEVIEKFVKAAKETVS